MRHSIHRSTRICVAALLAFSALFFSLATQADTPLTEAQALLAQGQRTQALDKIERVIAANPKDRQARFLKGVILAELNKLDEATSIFQKLTEEAPELPEPYNNLAVIYAQQKQFDKAKAALEMAIRTHPSYAVAHENLGDLYAKMARQAYDRALQIDAKNSNAQAKLNLLRELNTAAVRPASTIKPAAMATASSNRAVVALETPQATKPQTNASSQSSIAMSSHSSAAPVVNMPPSTPEPTKRREEGTSKQSDENRKAALAAVHGWADAWSNKNVKSYLGFYAKDFAVPGKQSRVAWEKERTERIDKPGTIKISLSELDARVSGDKAIVRFKQNYQSANFKSASGKTLELVLRNGHWQITQERIGR